jgi:hypothetical protein
MEEIMGHVVADVPEYSSTIHRCSRIPIIKEDSMCQLPEWGCKDEEQRRGHHESILVHRKVVMDAMKEKVCCKADAVIWEVSVSGLVDFSGSSGALSLLVKVEQAPMEYIFNQRPDEQARQPICGRLKKP